MTNAFTLPKYSFGVGDRFAHQAAAQLRACMMAAEQGVEVVPVWNKSNREHAIIGSEPASVRVPPRTRPCARSAGSGRTHVDADHINLDTVDRFIERERLLHARRGRRHRQAGRGRCHRCASSQRHPELCRPHRDSPASTQPFESPATSVARIAAGTCSPSRRPAASTATSRSARGRGTSSPRSRWTRPTAPRRRPSCSSSWRRWPMRAFPSRPSRRSSPGRFNKGVDYVGDLAQFEREFRDDLAVMALRRPARYGLPANLKLSVHSGSDKFSIYAPIRRALREFRRRRAPQDRRHHLARGTDRPGRSRRRRPGARQGDVYAGAFDAPRRAVRPLRHRHRHRPGEAARARRGRRVDVGSSTWPRCATIRAAPDFNPHLRQLLHVGYKIAAKMGDRYLGMLDDLRASRLRAT